jgi:hypothetical protein
MTGVTDISGDITDVSNGNPMVVTSAAHGLLDGQFVKITQVVGMENVNNRRYRVFNVSTDTFDLQDPMTRKNEDGTELETYGSGGMWNRIDRVNDDRVFYNP